VWLGFSAAFIGVLYALLKFLTVHRVRHLKEERIQVRHEVQKTDQRLEFLREKLGIAQSKKRTLDRETAHLREIVDKLHARLQSVLPQAMLPQLERCRTLHTAPSSSELQLLQELDLSEAVSRALDPLSLLILQLPTRGNADQNPDAARLTQQLSGAKIHFHATQDGLFSCVFSSPQTALDLLATFLAELPPERAAEARGSLHAGLELTDEKDAIKRLFARNLQRTKQLLERAPAGALLMNEEAFEDLEKRDVVQLFDDDDRTYAFYWSQSDGENPA
jgi:hypothetical protein